MYHPNTGYFVYYDAHSLTSALPGERREMLKRVVEGIYNQDVEAANTAYCLGRDIAGIPESAPPSPVSFDTQTSHGKLTTSVGLNLLMNKARLHGFIEAIRRWPEQEAVIDVGCGPFPILALAAALHHQKSEVSALDINADSAGAAEQLIAIFGLGDRVHVTHADIANYSIDTSITAAVTETFDSALHGEPGPRIVRLLHDNGVPIITPSKAELCLRMPEDGAKFTQSVDLRSDTHADIAFEGWSHNPENFQMPDISATYYDDFGLVLPYGVDAISCGMGSRYTAAGINLRKVMRGAGESGRLVYELGAHPFEPSVVLL